MLGSFSSLFSRSGGPCLMNRSGSARRGALRGGPGMLQPLERRIALSVVPDNHSILKFETSYGSIYIELFDDIAPISVANFTSYVNSDRIDNTFFHRMVKRNNGVGIDILQGGGFYWADGDTPPPRSVNTDAPIVLENSGRSNVAGTLAMARTSVANSATSQFFFNVRDNTNLDIGTDPGGGYAVFGQVIKGLDVVETIFALRTFDLDGSSQSLYDNVPVSETFDPNNGDGAGLTESDLVYVRNAAIINRHEYRAVAGSQVSGAVNTQDQLIITALGLNGRGEAFTPKNQDEWQYTNLTTATGSPTLRGNIEPFYDPKTGLRHAVAPSDSGLILFTQNTAGQWSFTNLTTTIAGGQVIEGEITVFTTTDGFVNIAGMSDAGHLVLFRQAGTASNWAWEYHNISTQDLATRGLTTPSFTGRLTSYVTAWNGLNVVGLDADGRIQAVWWAPGIDQNLWTATNLSEVVGAPRFVGGLTVYLTSWYATNIVGITQQGHVSVTWWLPEFGGNWRTDNLTTLFNGSLLVGNTISSFVTPWGATNIAGLDSTGKLWVYWWAPGIGDNAWVITDMSSAVPQGTYQMVGRIRGVTSPANTINLVGTAVNGDVMRYYWNPAGDQQWKADDVSFIASIS
ncbi:MAG: peptidylprolyl isomerase [Phycisphaeraceae bacterium]|nr:peptidylprolyl isomerase [Phycisphaerae bacterium]MBX3392934.1 peptidylprolyl isomerase [Phycisphaeraceae bacterium]HRJ49570.1 peptidylprolyl isomerase [Phycisphaerales bacterium]